jgi:hypothetical protein
MRFTSQDFQRLAERVLDQWKKQNVVVFKADEKAVLASAVKALAKDYQKELDLDIEVRKMLDDLERSNPGGFQRHKMSQLLKQKLAKEKKVVL